MGKGQRISIFSDKHFRSKLLVAMDYISARVAHLAKIFHDTEIDSGGEKNRIRGGQNIDGVIKPTWEAKKLERFPQIAIVNTRVAQIQNGPYRSGFGRIRDRR